MDYSAADFADRTIMARFEALLQVRYGNNRYTSYEPALLILYKGNSPVFSVLKLRDIPRLLMDYRPLSVRRRQPLQALTD